MTLGLWQIVIIVILGLLLFGGAGRIPRIMSDLAQGIKSFKRGLNEDDTAPKQIDADPIDAEDTLSKKTKDKS